MEIYSQSVWFTNSHENFPQIDCSNYAIANSNTTNAMHCKIFSFINRTTRDVSASYLFKSGSELKCCNCVLLLSSRMSQIRERERSWDWQMRGATPCWASSLHKSINCSEGYTACHSSSACWALISPDNLVPLVTCEHLIITRGCLVTSWTCSSLWWCHQPPAPTSHFFTTLQA